MNMQEKKIKKEKNQQRYSCFLTCYFTAGRLPVQHVVLLASGKF